MTVNVVFFGMIFWDYEMFRLLDKDGKAKE
jgi:hypothetical protein